MGTAALTYTLTAGTNENVNQVQQNFVDLRDFLNSGTGIGTNNIAVLPACRVRKTALQTITTGGGGTAITFDAERFDTDTMHSTAVNTSRITFTTAGVYVVRGMARFAANATGIRYAWIRLNGTTTLDIDHRPAISGDATTVATDTIYSFSAADYVEMMVLQTSGGNLDIEAVANYSPEFSAVFLSR